MGINLSTQSSQSQAIDVEERQLKVSSGAWTAIDQFRMVTANQSGDRASEYVGFTSSGADAVLVQYQTWAANLIAFKSASAGKQIMWRRTSDSTWAAGSTRNDAFLLLLRPDTLDSFSAPLPYADDYRSPSVSVSQGTDQGFDPAAAAYRFGANSSSQVSFSFGGSLARYLPRFIVTGYTASTWTVTLNGSVLSEGSDYVAAYDAGSATLSIQYVGGAIPAGSQVGIAPQAGAQTPTITSVTPPATLHVADESPDGFDIPYIQESRTLHVAASASGVPSGGGIEFVLDGASTFDMTAPFAADLTAGDGEHTLDVYIVDSSKTRLSNPEAHARRAQIGIGWMWSAIGDSITAGKYGDSTPGPVTNCSQD
ncbi:MAG: hypothetical protein IRY97_10955, partial [Thermomicrobiaceae bacterium]|nr:hypothetical protein [Thermomicrobiaceae bacterium]